MRLDLLPGSRHRSDDLATDLVPALTRQAPQISRPRSVFPDFATDLTPALTPHITPAYAKGPRPGTPQSSHTHTLRTSPRYSPPDSAQLHTPAPCQHTPQSSHEHTPPASSRNSPQIRPQRLSLELRPRRKPGLHLAFRSHSQPGLLLTLADHHVCGFVLHNRWDLMDLSAQMVTLKLLSGLFNLDGGAAPLKSHKRTTWSD